MEKEEGSAGQRAGSAECKAGSVGKERFKLQKALP